MKLLYIVNIIKMGSEVENIKAVNFKVAQVLEETETSYITLDKINVYDCVNEFSKNNLNREFRDGFVTDKLDKAELKKQIDRIRKEIDEVNQLQYEKCLGILEKIK